MGSKYAIDERVRRVVAGGQIHEVVEELVAFPKGEAIVELRDVDSGKLTHYEKSDNFIAPQWAVTSRSYQRLGWDSFPFNLAAGLDRPGGAMPVVQFPNQAIACWYSATAESPSTEHVIDASETGIIAWASRLPVGSPTGSRGAINVSTSSRTLGGESLVYDWPSTSGNGTFRSVGYTVMKEGTGIGYSVQGVRASPYKRHYLFDNGTPTTVFGSQYVTSPGAVGLDSANNLVIPFTNISSRRVSWYAVPSSVWDQAWAYDEIGATEDNFGVSPVTDKVLTSNGNNTVNFLGGGGGFYYFGYTVGSNATFCRMNTSAFTTDKITTTAVTGTGISPRGVLIGTDLFIINGTSFGSNGLKVYRYDVSGTPSLTATITLSCPSWMDSTSYYATSITTDGTDLLIYVAGSIGSWMRFDTSGNRLRMLGAPLAVTAQTASSPFAGTYVVEGLAVFSAYWFHRPYYGGSGSGSLSILTSANNGAYQGSGLGCANTVAYPFFHGGRFFAAEPFVISSPVERIACSFAELGYNLGSRVLLGSDTTKTSSNTMKITYNVTLPDYIP